MYRQIRGLGLACGAALAMPGSASAQVIPMSFAEIVAEAIDSRSEWITNGTNRAIVTRVTFRVSDTYKGLDRFAQPDRDTHHRSTHRVVTGSSSTPL